MVSEEKKGETPGTTFEHDGEEYDLKLSVVSAGVTAKLMRISDQGFWECTANREELMKKCKRWCIFPDEKEIVEFIAYAIKKGSCSVNLSDDQVFTLFLKYQTPTGSESVVSISLPRMKVDIEKMVMLQSQTITSLRKTVKSLEANVKAQAEERKKQKTCRVVPVKIFDLGVATGHSTSYTISALDWTDIQSAKGDLDLEGAAKIKLNFYATSLFTASGGNAQVFFRIVIKGKTNGQIKYLSGENGAGFYPLNGYGNIFTMGDIIVLEAGKYDITAQWQVTNVSYPVTWYGSHRGEIKLLGEVYYEA